MSNISKSGFGELVTAFIRPFGTLAGFIMAAAVAGSFLPLWAGTPLFVVAFVVYVANRFGVLPLPPVEVLGIKAGDLVIMLGIGLSVGAGVKGALAAMLLSAKLIGIVAVVSVVMLAALYGYATLKAAKKPGE